MKAVDIAIILMIIGIVSAITYAAFIEYRKKRCTSAHGQAVLSLIYILLFILVMLITIA